MKHVSKILVQKQLISSKQSHTYVINAIKLIHIYGINRLEFYT